MTIRVLIADDNKLFREILSRLFKDSTDIEIVAQAEDGLDVLEKVRLTKPDIVLMDIGMPRLNGIETTRTIRKKFPETKIIALTTRDEKAYIKGIFEAGAKGYLSKSCSYDQLVDAIEQVSNGKKYVSADITEIIIQDYLEHDNRGSMKHPKLTDRESEVMKLLAEGTSIRGISETLFISIKTVGTHKQNIFDKLEFENMAHLIKFALKNGIVSI